MIANFHTHTPRCNHAVGTEQEYIAQAKLAGLTELGFSDHTPYLFPQSYYSHFRMKPEELAGYVASLKSLREENRSWLTMHIGVEAEYYPKFFDATVDFLRENGIEYMLLGQHFTGSELDGTYTYQPTDDTALLEQYVRQSITAMETGLYTYFAHPDVIYYTGSRESYRQWMHTLVREAKNCGLPLEFNLLGFKSGRNYPNNAFLELVAQENMPMILGCDAHEPEALNTPEAEQKARALLDSFGIPVLDTVPIRRI